MPGLDGVRPMASTTCCPSFESTKSTNNFAALLCDAFAAIAIGLHPIAIAAKASHSSAAKLFVDFVLSKEGQQVVLAMGRTPSRPGIDTKMQSKNLKLFPVPPELGENYNQYQKEFSDLFR